MSKITAESRPDARLMNKTCQTLDIAIPGYEECLRGGPNPCRYALPFGYSFLCHHPRLRETQPDRPRGAVAGRRTSGADLCS